MEEKKGFFAVLFDLNFTQFLTPKIIKILFILGICGAGLSTFGFIVGGFSGGLLGGALCLLLSPLVFILMVLGVRMWLELFMMGFKIAHNTTILAEAVEKKKED